MLTAAEEAWALAFPGLTLEDGIALREGTAWRAFPGNDPARFAGLLSIAALDAFLRTDAARSPRISMADGARQGSAAVPPHEYLAEDGERIDLPRLLARHDAGASLVIAQFQDIHPPLARFCRGLEKAFLHAVQANIYLTPPGAQGFRRHFDTHDVLVMQVSGSKSWRVWDELPYPAPTRNTPWTGKVDPAEQPHALTLAPGDVLYLPRGVIHEAMVQAGSEPSLHITIGLMEPAMAEMLHDLLEAMEGEAPALRAACPTWRLGEPGGMAVLAARLAEAMAALAAPGAAERIAFAAMDRLARDRMPLPARSLHSPAPQPQDRLRLSDVMHYSVLPEPDGGARLLWHGGVAMLGAEELGWLHALEEGARPAELAGDALPFCHRLERMGLLERLH